MACPANPSCPQQYNSLSQFAVLASSTVTNTGSSVITNGDVGVFAGTAITGFPPAIIVGGVQHSADAVAGQAQTDLTNLHTTLAGLPYTDLGAVELGGLTLTCGAYNNTAGSGELAISAGQTLTLDGGGDSGAIFILKSASTLITGAGSQVVLINGAQANNVYWVLGSSATLGTNSIFKGKILAQASVTATTGANIEGALWASTGAVTLDTNNINHTNINLACTCPIITITPPTLPAGVNGTPYSQVITASGGSAPYVFSLASGSLPNGLSLNTATDTTITISGTPTVSGTFTFTIQAIDQNGCVGTSSEFIIINPQGGCPVITVNPATLPDATIAVQYNQTVSASGGAPPYTFAVTSGMLPIGLTLNASTGLISGIPNTVGSFTFTITATDMNGCMGATSYTIVSSTAVRPNRGGGFGAGFCLPAEICYRQPINGSCPATRKILNRIYDLYAIDSLGICHYRIRK